MSGWEVLDFINFDGEIVVKDHQLHPYRTRATTPPAPVGLANVGTILLREDASLPSGMATAAAYHGVSLIFCDWTYAPVSAVHSWGQHSRVGARQLAQYTASVPQRKQVWQSIIQAKITGQAWVLRTIGDNGWEHLLDIARNVKSGDTGNAEAVAAAFYWKRVFGPGFVRDRTFGDPHNCALNYGYTILRARAKHAVAAAGLHPGLGVFHRGHRNPFALADDFIEPFRPAVDAAVLGLSTVDMNVPDTKKALVAASTALMGNKQKTVSTEMVALAQNVGMFFEDKSVELRAPVWFG